MLEITDQDRKNYEARSALAADQAAELAQAVAACGPGAKAYGIWILRDKLQLEPDVRFYCCRRNGQVGWKPEAPENTVRMTADQHPGYSFNGQVVYPFRYALHFGDLPEYRPVPPEKLALRRARRKLKACRSALESLKTAARNSLFPDQYAAEIAQLQQRESHLIAQVESGEKLLE